MLSGLHFAALQHIYVVPILMHNLFAALLHKVLYGSFYDAAALSCMGAYSRTLLLGEKFWIPELAGINCWAHACFTGSVATKHGHAAMKLIADQSIMQTFHCR